MPNSDEHSLLLLIAKPEHNASEREALKKLLGKRLDWNYCLETAASQSLSSIMFAHLKELEQMIPKYVFDALQQAEHQSRQRNVRLHNHLVQLTQRLSEEDIRFVIVEGPHLEDRYYPEGTVRHCDELVLYLYPRDWHRSITLFESAQFPVKNEYKEISSDELAAYSCCFQPIWLQHADGSVVKIIFSDIEFGFRSIDVNIVERSQQYTWRDLHCRILSDEDLMIRKLVLFHASNFSHFSIIADIYQILLTSGHVLDWQYIIYYARLRKMQRAIYRSLKTSCDITGYCIPGYVLAKLKSNPLKNSATFFLWDYNRSHDTIKPAVKYHRLFFPIFEMDSLFEKAGLITKLLFPPRAWLESHAPETNPLVARLQRLLQVIQRDLEQNKRS